MLASATSNYEASIDDLQSTLKLGAYVSLSGKRKNKELEKWIDEKLEF